MDDRTKPLQVWEFNTRSTRAGAKHNNSKGELSTRSTLAGAKWKNQGLANGAVLRLSSFLSVVSEKKGSSTPCVFDGVFLRSVREGFRLPPKRVANEIVSLC